MNTNDVFNRELDAELEAILAESLGETFTPDPSPISTTKSDPDIEGFLLELEGGEGGKKRTLPKAPIVEIEPGDPEAVETEPKKVDMPEAVETERESIGVDASANPKLPSLRIDQTISEGVRKKLADEMAGILTNIDGAPKKVGDKAVNVFRSVEGRDTLSVFTKMAIDYLEAHETADQSDIKAMYIERPYSIGTANAQSGQMVKLLPLLGIASIAGKTLTLNRDSPLLSLLN